MALSSVIAARVVVLPDIRYVFIHLPTRETVLHQSGCEILGDELVDEELLANMAGRAGRTRDGTVFYLFELDDSAQALRAATERQTETPKYISNPPVTLV